MKKNKHMNMEVKKMSKRTQKWIGLTIITFIIFSFLSCTQSEDVHNETEQTSLTDGAVTTTKAVTTTATTTTAPVVTTTKEAVNPFAKPLEISYLVRFAENYEEGRWDELELEEKFNIDLKVWNISHTGEDCILMAAAGDWPDTGHVNFDPIRAYTDGLTRNISLKQIQTMLPEYYKILESNPIGMKINKIPTEEDKYYGLSFCYAQNNYWYCVNCFRMDWLENIGYDVDGFEDLTEVKISYEGLSKVAEGKIYMTNHVFPYEEFLEIMRAFTEDDPDGNSEDDTYGAMFPQNGPSYGSEFTNVYTGMFGIVHDYNNWLYLDSLTNDYVPSYATVGWRDFLVFINDMLSKGYMTYLVNSGGADFHYNFYAHFNQGAFGHFPLDVYANMNPANIERINNWFPNGLLENDPEATFLIVPRLVGPDGKGGNKRYVNVPFRDGATGTWTFGAGCDDEKLERCMALLRYTHFTDEAFYRYFYGIENVHYKWSGEPYNSAIIATEYSKIPKKYTAGASTQKIFATDKFLMDFKKWSMLSEFFYQICNYQIEHEWFIKYTIEPDKLVHRLYMGDEKYDEFIKLRQEINSDILTVANDFRNKAFKGELADINAEWSYYIEALYRAGLEQYVEYFNDESFGLYEIEKESLYE
jgi:hypothetical protein